MPKPTTLRGLVTSRNLRALTIELIVLAAVVAGLTVYHREIYSRVFGPFSVTVDEVAAIPSLDSEFRRYFVLDGSGLVRLPFSEEIVHRRRGRETGRSYLYYFALAGNQRTLIIRSSERAPLMPVVGVLEPLPAAVTGQLARPHPQLRIGASVAPLMFDVEDPLGSWGSFYTAAALAAPVIVLLFLVLTLGRLRSFQRSRPVAALARFQVPVGQVVAVIDSELATDNTATPMRNVLLTRSWLVHLQPFKLEVIHLDELVWVHAAITRRYMYWIIPAGATHSVRLGDRNGHLREVQGKKNTVPDTVVAIAQRVPWVFAGHSDELEQAYRRNRDAIIAAVDQRRQQVLGGSHQAAG
jgi:hypothetical protein